MSEASPAPLVPRLPRGVRLRHDAARDRWVVMAPERMFVPDETALAVLRLVDGQRSLDDIATRLAADYAAPREVIAADVAELLRELEGKGVVALA
jgi:pyrroloquinoline quinone biosynthesis protein D